MFKRTVIGVIIVAILFVASYLGYSYYSYKCDIYNQIILGEVQDVMKGNVSYNEIETLDVPDIIKEQLKDYYDETFYKDEDKIFVLGNIDIYDRIKDDISNAYLSYSDMFSYLRETYGEMLDFYLSSSDNLTDEELIKISEINFYFMYQNKPTNHKYIKENNNLYILVSDLTFNKGVCECNYDGLTNYIVEDIIEKKVRQSLSLDKNVQDINPVLISENREIDIYNLSKLGSVSFIKKLGKYVSIEF